MGMAEEALDFAGGSKAAGGSPYMWVLRGLVLFVAAFVWGNPARAEPGHPTPPLQLVVPVPPGGGPDCGARIMAAYFNDAAGTEIFTVTLSVPYGAYMFQ